MTRSEILLAELALETHLLDRNQEKMKAICDELEALGTYPQNGYNRSTLKMVESWGAYWHEYKGTLNCPNCNVDLRDERGPPGKREIGVVINDRVAYFLCPNCEGRIERE